MSVPIEILALEPYHGGVRRQMLQAIMRLSRHHWTLLKLPARRVERRLAAASRWFAEHIVRDELDVRTQLLFTSETLNLSDLQRIVPKLAGKPSVVYFHDNQMPTPEQGSTGPLDMVNLNSAMAATECWFNSSYHEESFLEKAAALVSLHPEIAGRSPVAALRAKIQIVPPPAETGMLHDVLASGPQIFRDPRTLFVDVRGSDRELLVDVLRRLELRGEAFNVITVGPQRGIPDDIPRLVIHERDEAGQFRALHEAGIFIGLRHAATTDDLIVPALAAGCWPVVPEIGLYPELLPPALHLCCLHDGSVESIVNRILDAWYAERPVGFEFDQQEILSRFDASPAVRLIDERVEDLVIGRAMRA